MKRSYWNNSIRSSKRVKPVANEVNPMELLAAMHNSPDVPDMHRGLGEDPESKLYARGRHIYFQDHITFDTATALIRQINDLTEELEITCRALEIDSLPITLHITSPGGVMFAAMMIIDAMTSSKIPIDTVVEGYAASAGTLISIHGRHRAMTKNGTMLCHQARSDMWGTYTEEETKDNHENMKKAGDKIKQFYEERTNMTKNQLKELLKHDLDWDADECLKRGLVDEIL